MANTVQRRFVWVAMALLLFVALYGQSAWRSLREKGDTSAAGGMVDNAVTPPDEVPDRVRQAAPGVAAAGADDPAQDLIMPGDLKLPDSKPMLAVEGERLFGGVPAKLLEVLQDDTVWRSDENDIFFRLLKALKDASEPAIEQASIGRKTFVQLFQQADDYRGQIVTVGGKVASIKSQYNPLPNSQGIKAYHDVWFFPDGTKHMPMAVIALDVPPGLEVGSHFDATGYFYKRLGYSSREPASGDAAARGMKDVFRSSPVVLAKELQLRPVAVAQTTDEGPDFLAGVSLPLPSKYVLPLIGGGMILLTSLTAWAYRLSRTTVRSRGGPIVGRGRTDAAAEPTNLNALNTEP